MAERLIPAADLSEQISTAGKEASGTGNMKFALNGALTIGTLDGANVEIREHVGAENFFLFGMTAEEVVARRADRGACGPCDCRRSATCAARSSAAQTARSAPGCRALFARIADNVSGPDYFLVASDFTDFWRRSARSMRSYADPARWMAMAARNTARSGWFSSDRTIRSYMADIWDAEVAGPLRKLAAE